MTQQIINIGSAPDDNTGDPLRTAFNKSNLNFTEVYTNLDLKSNLYLTHNRQTSSYVLILTDKDTKLVEMNSGSGNNLTVPLNSSVAFPVGTQIAIVQYGAGLTTVVASGGVTIHASSGVLTSPGQYCPMILEKIATDEWYLWNGSPATSSVTPAALTKVDDTNVTLTLGGTPSTALLQASSITAGWTGTLANSRGGLGSDISASGVIGDILQASSSSAFARLASVATGNVFLSGGIGTASSWGKVTSSHVNSTILTNTTGWLTTGTTTLTGDVTIASTNLIGFGVSPTAKFHLKGIGTTTNEVIRVEDSGGTLRMTMFDRGDIRMTNTPSSATGRGAIEIYTGASGSASMKLTYNGLIFGGSGGEWYGDMTTSVGTPVMLLANSSVFTHTASTARDLKIGSSFTSSTGTGDYTMIDGLATINFTGGTHTVRLADFKIQQNGVTGLTLYGVTVPATNALNGFGISTPTATLHAVGTIKLDGSVTLPTAGNGILIKEGTNATMGTATLSGGTITINTTKVTANSRVFISINGGTLTNVGSVYEDKANRTAGTSFIIKSTNVLDAADVAWVIIEPAP